MERIRSSYLQRGEDPTPVVKALLGLELVLCGASAVTWVAYFADWDRAVVWGMILVSEALLATKVTLTGLVRPARAAPRHLPSARLMPLRWQQLHAKAVEQQPTPREARA